MINFIRAESGSIFVFTLIVLIILTLLCLVLLDLSVISVFISYGGQDTVQAFYQAEAGLEYTFHRLKHDWSWPSTSSNVYITPDLSDLHTFKSGDFQVRVKATGDNDRRIWSKSKLNGAKRTLQADVNRKFILNDFFSELEDLLQYTVVAEEIVLSSSQLNLSGAVRALDRFSVPEGSIYDDSLIQVGEGYPRVDNLTPLAVIDWENFDSESFEIQVIEGPFHLPGPSTRLPHVWVILSTEDAPGDVVIDQQHLASYAGNPVMVLAEGQISYRGHHAVSKTPPLLMLSTWTGSGIILEGDHIEIEGHLLAPYGSIESSFSEQIELAASRDCVWYRYEMSNFKYQMRED